MNNRGGAWALHQVPSGSRRSSATILGWEDLEQREARLGIRPGQWFLIEVGKAADADLLAFFPDPVFARKADDTRRAYARDLKVHFEFLAGNGRSWKSATAADFADYEFWRRRDPANPGRVSGAKFNREVAACRLFYEWQVRRGAIPASPVVISEIRRRDGSIAAAAELRSRDVRSSRVNWLTPRAYRRWRDVGLGGYTVGGLPQSGWRGRNDGRNLAFAELVWTSGLRLREAGTLLTCEIPAAQPGVTYLRGRVGNAVAKGAGREYWVSATAVGQIAGYVVSTRSAAINRAHAERRYEQLADVRIVESVNRRRQITYTDARGEIGTVSLDVLDAAERMQLFTETAQGLEPMWLWLGESGLPMSYQSWEACFGRANRRCRRLGVPIHCHPHMLRHSFALRLLVTLQHVFDRRFGLTVRERAEYRHLFGDPWVMVKELLGHRSIDTTRDIYLQPATRIQLDLLLNGDDQDDGLVTTILSRLARQSPRMLDLPAQG